MQSLFISDLHLDAVRPRATDAFMDFLLRNRSADALYILGDLFEAWIGDDDPDPHFAMIAAAMADFAEGGCACYIMHGNRDFLIGEKFCQQTGFTLLEDPTVLSDAEPAFAIMHGDTLCTGDKDYQEFRRQVREPGWQADFLSQPIEKRREFASMARDTSARESSRKNESIMDVEQPEVDRVMQAACVDVLVHGHTHRPDIHEWQIGDSTRKRIVLGDWYQQGSVLKLEGGNFELKFFDF